MLHAGFKWKDGLEGLMRGLERALLRKGEEQVKRELELRLGRGGKGARRAAPQTEGEAALFAAMRWESGDDWKWLDSRDDDGRDWES